MRLCITIECNDQFTVANVASIFKGTAMTGAWTVFNLFNEIEPVIMSSIAQML